ncbi:hypothetical protein [Nibricoccus sp. IMCC34717]|uniref:hypothetical protein n=1 Tax=Nibricoccus sp. IMCC34717 TaxID=3034021 RepID=UPI00384BB21F
MWLKFRDQIPAVLITVIVVLAAAIFLHQKTVSDLSARQQQELAVVREQHQADLKAAADETNRRIEAVNTMLKEAIQKRASEAFMTDEEFQKANAEKINQLAEAIAMKMQPNMPLPKTPEEAERLQNEQIDKVSGRMAERIQPILAEMAKDQHLTRDQIASYSQRISDQVGTVLTTELAKNQQLNSALLETQGVARDSLRVSQEVTALYLSSFKDQGLITRILSLPANVVKDASSMSLVNSADRKKAEERLFKQIAELEKRLNEAQATAPKK